MTSDDWRQKYYDQTEKLHKAWLKVVKENRSVNKQLIKESKKSTAILMKILKKLVNKK